MSEKNNTQLKPNINDERAVRIDKLKDLSQKGINAYPAKTASKVSVNTALSAKENQEISIAGRIITKREMGKITFCHLQDETDKMQIALKSELLGAENYKFFLKIIDPGDIIFVSGKKITTQKGEPSILLDKWQLLAKSVLPLPDKYHGLQDEEIRLRKRYLDFIVNPNLKNIFYKKAVFWQSMREFLTQESFLEVETPVLEATPGGADANPFVTHHNALDINLYLRISMGELWQKRLMVAGFEKTFEIGRQFRNEGIDREHLQDYAQMEFYWAYADYEMGMSLVEKMYKFIIKKTFGTLIFDINNFSDINFDNKWERIDYVETIIKKTGINILTSTDLEIKNKLNELGVRYENLNSKVRLIDSLWKYCRKTIKGPVFLVHHPVIISPLAKKLEKNPNLTERYQVIIAGSEVGNGYSELNDPLDQAERFLEQAKLREGGDAEAQMHDKDFVEALEHGMPPTTGFGVSERLFSFLCNKPIRECVIFPLLKPEQIDNSDTLSSNIEQKKYSKLPFGRLEAWELVKQYNKEKANLNHYLESEAIMKALAIYLKEDKEYWGMLGLLHDIDWEITKKKPELHLTKAPDILKQAGFRDDFIEYIVSHGYGCKINGLEDKKRNKRIEHALACSETVTGLIYTTALMRPDHLTSMDTKSLLKKFKDKKFATTVNRQIILECEKLGLNLEEFLKMSLDAVRSISNMIGLKNT